MRKRTTTWGLIVCMVLFTVGCGSEKDEGSSGKDGKDGGNANAQSTPKETFEGFKDCVSKDDWSTAFNYVTEESQSQMLGGTVMASAMTVGFSQDKENGKTLEDLLKKHGIDSTEAKKPPEGDPEAAMTTLLADVKDKGACFQELMKFMKDISEEKEKDSGPADKIKKTVFKDAKIDGDKASVTFTVDGKDDEEPMIFTKKDGKWFIDMIATQEEAMKKFNKQPRQKDQN